LNELLGLTAWSPPKAKPNTGEADAREKNPNAVHDEYKAPKLKWLV